MSWQDFIIAFMAGLPGVITAISSFRNGNKLTKVKKQIENNQPFKNAP
jgi:hypothetical protein